MGPCHVLDHVLEESHGVGGLGQAIETDVDFGLAGGGDFVVVLLDDNAEMFDLLHHLGADVLEGVEGRSGEVAFFVAGPVGEVILAVDGFFCASVPESLVGVDEVVAGVYVLVEAGGVEHEELRLGGPSS